MHESWIHRSCSKCGREWDETINLDNSDFAHCGCDTEPIESGEDMAALENIPGFWEFPIQLGIVVFIVFLIALACSCAPCVNECDLGAGYQPDLPLCDSTNVKEIP